MTRPFLIPVLAAFLGAIALPVQGFFPGAFFFNASDKYLEWFHDPLRHLDPRSEKTHQGFRLVSAARPTAEMYPYPDKAYVMSKKRWLKSANEAIRGDPDWFDVEVVRQRAEVEEYAPAMALLGWMYQEGRGLNKDLRKAYNMYERAKLSGNTKIRGNTAKIFQRLTQPEKLVAEIVLQEDIQRINPDKVLDKEASKQVKLHVMKEQRELNTLRFKRKVARNGGKGPLGFAN